ncbi:MAG: 30S ribosomal protein S8 [Lacunisphaera sp.]|jgi:small subunit ribosomal protein S8|nr:30S ribosomal protein S8 [Opitutae bacterium]MSU19694.1 30S ribosomal protein S8 [Lacunisphaera sp.]NBX58875.1 30S ribosomal protein S8 [Opitutaceae bacterium]PAW87184.1 MAG: 30S ribosomal protein S8 [Opitutae bacterium Tous-C10FEB]
MTDPISDFLTRLRNASKAGLAECVMPHSKLKESLAGILKAEGFVRAVATGTEERGHKTLIVTMKYVDSAPVITGLKRTSTPGRRIYTGYSEIPRVLNGLGLSIISTSKGLMKDQDARRHKLGGELVCTVW